MTDRKLLFLMNVEQAKAFARLLEAGNRGDGSAACRLGDMYREGLGGLQYSPKETHRWYARSALAGDANGQNNLGACYEHGLGCAQSYAKAVKWYRLAAAQNLGTASMNLGYCYLRGKGLPADKGEALRLFRLAVQQDEPKAADELKRLGEPVEEPKVWVRQGIRFVDETEAGKHIGLVGVAELPPWEDEGIRRELIEILKVGEADTSETHQESTEGIQERASEMDTYPKPIFRCEGLTIWVLGPGKNPMAEVRREDGSVINGTQQLMSIVAHIDLDEWDPVPENPSPLEQRTDSRHVASEASVMKRTKSQDRVSIEIAVFKDSKPFAAIGYANRGKQVVISPEDGTPHDEIEAITKAARKQNGRSWGRPSFRRLVHDFKENGYAARIVRDAYRSEFQPLTVADVPFEQLIHAFWRRQALHFDAGKGRKRDKAKRGSEVHHLEDEVWPKEETWVNKVLDVVMTACPPSAVASALGALLPDIQLVDPSYGRNRIRDLTDHVGDPDFALWDEDSRTLILGESKIAAKKSNGRYSFDQFSKYMLHGALATLSRRDTHVVHIIVTASDKPAEFCNDADQWVERGDRSVGKKLRVSRDAIQLSRKVGRKQRKYRNFEKWKEYAREQLANDELREANGGYSKADVDKLLNKSTSPVLVPTYVVTWDALCGQLEKACKSHHAGHLVPAIHKLEQLGSGQA